MLRFYGRLLSRVTFVGLPSSSQGLSTLPDERWQKLERRGVILQTTTWLLDGGLLAIGDRVILFLFLATNEEFCHISAVKKVA